MRSNYLTDVLTLFKNVALNSMGVERDLYQLLAAKDVPTAISLMQNRDEDVDNALTEYTPQKHKIMKRPNKPRKGEAPYITEKLPRSRQRYINEVALFFLFGNNVVWSLKEGDSEVFKLFQDFLKKTHFDSRMRTAKRLAGAETESAKLYNIFRDADDNIVTNVVILARSTGYTLRPMFDKFGNLAAFAYGYKLKQNGRQIQHWDIQTPNILFYCEQSAIGGWRVEQTPNPTGKINVIYYKQVKEWEGSEKRLEREEFLDSKIGDTNNYFADPVAIASADVVELMQKDNATARLIQMTGANSRFEYVNPPTASQLQATEKDNLEKSVLFDTFTPDFSFEALRGMGTLSGAAIRNSMILGYIKRARNIELYQELLEREKNVILAILKYQYPQYEAKINEMQIDFEFAEPFPDDIDTRWQRISQLYGSGLVSMETAVNMLGLTDNPDEEIDRIMLLGMEKGENKPVEEQQGGAEQQNTEEQSDNNV